MKDKLNKALKWARKHMAALICGVVVVIAVVLCYWPTQAWYTELEAKVDKSITLATQITGLLKKDRHLPNVSADPNATPQLLEVYPTDDVYQKGLAAVKALGTQSTNLLGEAVDLNTHVPLYPNALPNGNDLDRASFGSAYKDAMDDDFRIRHWPPEDLKQSIPALMAGRRIDDQDVKKAEDIIQNDVNLEFPQNLANGQPNPDAQAQAKAVFDDRTKNLALLLEHDAAEKCKVYLESGALKPPAVYTDFKTATQSQSPDEVWLAQMTLWIDEDVATAVARANANAKNVMDAPIKQIMEVTVKDPPYLIAGDPTVGKEDAALTPAPDVTPSGRASNGMYDVVQFSVSLDVDANQVPQMLDAMQHGQFITVLTVQSQAVDSYERAAARFIYGNSPVVHLDLVCEELLLHNWTSKFQPPDAGAAKYMTGGTSSGTPLVPIATHGG